MIKYRGRIKTARHRACEDRLFNRRMLKALPFVRKMIDAQETTNIPAAEQVTPWSALANKMADQVVTTVGSRRAFAHKYVTIGKQVRR